MGEVYRAIDTNLKRQVAIKVLPPSLASDADRVARFEREAETLARLNHPNIAHIHGLERSDGTVALAMELVEGPTLADRIADGPFSLADALPIAKQIARALDAAHEQGIVHRDLKPANIKLRDDGTVKILDFGLAKAMTPPGAPSAAITTIASPAATHAGIILGTPAYMSPEQASGKNVDKRADIWAFGVVLYEMLTGHPLFAGDSLTETLAAVVKDRPDLSRVPPAVRPLVDKCLEKDPRARLRDIGDFELLLRDGDSPPRRTHAAATAGWITAAVVLVAATIGWFGRARANTVAPTLTATIIPPPDTPLSQAGGLVSAPEISPDGSRLLYSSRTGLYVRSLDSLTPLKVPGSEYFSNKAFWSADSNSVFYPGRAQLFRVRLPDGAPEAVMPLSGFSRGGSESERGGVLVSVLRRLQWLPAPGAKAQVLEVPGLARGRIAYPEFLPDGRSFIFLWRPDDGSSNEVYLASLDAGKVVEPVALLRNDTAARYTPAGGGRILFVRDDNLYSQRLDLDRRKLAGDSELMERHVSSAPGLTVDFADFSVSRSGVVAWRPGTAALAQATAFDRHGTVVGTTGPPMPASDVRLSPDERRLLLGGDRAWVLDVDQRGRLAAGGEADWRFWSPDGSRLIGVTSDRTLVERPVSDGDIRTLGHLQGTPVDLSSDGTRVLERTYDGNGFIVQRLDGVLDEHAGKPLVSGDAEDTVAGESFSPDGKWIVYASGTAVFVQPYPGPGFRRQLFDAERVPIEGPKTLAVRSPQWRGDGREIVFYGAPGRIYSIPVSFAGGAPQFGTPTVLFSGVRRPAGLTASSLPLAVSRDGSRIYWMQGAEQSNSDVIHIRTNALH
jgi:serine/threonine protein kinase